MGTQARSEATGALVERLLGAALGFMDLLCVHIGDRLGLYRALDAAGSCTPRELAAHAGVAPRYAREWLEQQALTGILEIDDEAACDDARRYRLPPAHAPVLLADRHGPHGAHGPADGRMRASRRPRGGGVPLRRRRPVRGIRTPPARGPGALLARDVRQPPRVRVAARRPGARRPPPRRPARAGRRHRLRARPLAPGHRPRLPGGARRRVDLDRASVEAAERIHAGEPADVAGRVRFRRSDAALLEHAGAYDLITIFEALHDMSDPVGVLRSARGLLAPGGVALIGDERTADRFRLDAGEVEPLYYGFSVTHCLPVGMVGDSPAGTGTVMREGTVRDYAARAGFASTEVLPIDNDFWRFYLLRP